MMLLLALPQQELASTPPTVQQQLLFTFTLCRSA
jgi:hypothetical protein